MARAAVPIVLAWSIAGASPLGAPQAPAVAGHHHHALAAPAPAGASRPMAAQPGLDGIGLVDASGRAVTLDAALTADVPVLVNFIFTTCTTICPVMSAAFSRLDARLAEEGRPVRLVSISIDPDVDTPARLREYAASHGARADWWFLTGTPAAVAAAQRAFGAYRGSKENHAPTTYVRRGSDQPWEELDGLAGLQRLLSAYAGH